MKITIYNSQSSKLDEKVKKFSKKFVKYGIGNFIYIKSNPYICTDKKSNKYMKELIDIEIDANYQINGYDFLASLEYDLTTGLNIVKKKPGIENIPEKFITRTYCDHCKCERNRLKTVLLRNIKTNEIIQVGKTCVKDYLGRDLVDYAFYLNIFEELKEFEKLPFSIEDKYYKVEDVLNQTVAEIFTNGYVSNNMVNNYYLKYGEYSECPYIKTTAIIYSMYNGMEINGKVRDFHIITDEYKAYTNKVIEYINNHYNESDYLRNIYILITNQYIKNKDLALIVSAVGYYKSTIDRENIIESKSNFVGNIGDKIEIQCNEFSLENMYETVYGVTYIYKFVSNDNIFIWKTGKVLNTELNSIILKGTVKNHNEFKGIKQTGLTRCTIKEV